MPRRSKKPPKEHHALRPRLRTKLRPAPPEAPAPEPKRRSHAAAPVAVALLFVGLLLGTVTILVPLLLGFFLLWTGLSFLGTRMNPFSIGFYLTTKPSWSAIGVVFLSALLLWAVAYSYFIHGLGPILPHLKA